MGRKKVTIPINTKEFRDILNYKNILLSEIAHKYGVTRQAVNGWLKFERIPPRVLINISKDFGLKPQEVDKILQSIPKVTSISLEIKFNIEEKSTPPQADEEDF